MRALIVEDEPKVASFIAKELQSHAFAVDLAADGEAGERMARSNTYDVILLDWMLPRKSGIAVCRDLRRDLPQVPILMLTALDGVEDQVNSLQAGADDYLSKPFDLVVLMARIDALLRRSKGNREEGQKLSCGDLQLDHDARRVTRSGQEMRLTAREYALLRFLLQRKDKVCTRMEILEQVWDTLFDTETNVVDVYINMLRKKVDKPFTEKLIHTVTGMGYVIREPGA
ncbi:MAG: response regulator transcription factor [Flavobacteriales bacterium]|nr:response regulator transcription factor [Flavobacteriales bacterium]